MKASDARKVARTSMAGEGDMQPIFKAIQSAAENMKFEMFYHTMLTPGQKARLENDGYKVDVTSDRDGVLVKISW